MKVVFKVIAEMHFIYTSIVFLNLLPQITLHIFVCDSKNYMEKMFGICFLRIVSLKVTVFRFRESPDLLTITVNMLADKLPLPFPENDF